MQNPKHKVIEIIFGPLRHFMEEKMQISGLFIFVFLYALLLPIIKKNKSKDENVVGFKIIFYFAYIFIIIVAIKHTIAIRSL